MKEFTTHIGGERTIRAECGLLSRAGGELTLFGNDRRVAVLADRRTFSLHGPVLINSLTAAGYRPMPFLFRATERRKSPATLRAVLSFFAKKDMDKEDIVLCLGGEVLSDIGLMAASLYRGGLRTVLCPTTLTAQLLTSTGIECAVNFRGRRNCVGLSRVPELVLIDPSLLSASPKKEIACGMAYLIQYAMIADRALFDSLIEESQTPDLSELVPRCIEETLKLCEGDSAGQNNRGLLRFGHTLADSLVMTSRGRIPGGYALSIGMAELTRAAGNTGLCDRLLAEKLVALLRKFHLPTVSPYPIRRLLSRLIKDRKAKEGEMTVVIPLRPGTCEARVFRVAEAYRLFASSSPSV